MFPNKEIYMINESLAGVRYGQMAKFRICLNGQNDALDVRVTSEYRLKYFNEFINSSELIELN